MMMMINVNDDDNFPGQYRLKTIIYLLDRGGANNDMEKD